MSLSKDLASVGMPTEQALRLGYNVGTLTAVGTAQSGGAALNKQVNWVNVITSGGQTAVVLPSDAELYQEYVVYTTTATTALVFPPSGGAINAAGANNSVSVATLLARKFYRISTNVWVSFLAA